MFLDFFTLSFSLIAVKLFKKLEGVFFGKLIVYAISSFSFQIISTKYLFLFLLTFSLLIIFL
jgi:hypothetical protein